MTSKLDEELERLSKAATQGVWREVGGDAILTGKDHALKTVGSLTASPGDPAFVCALVNAYRARQVVPAQPSGDVVEAVARAVVPVKPTASMKMAGAAAITEDHMTKMANYDAAIDCWNAMIQNWLESDDDACTYEQERSRAWLRKMKPLDPRDARITELETALAEARNAALEEAAKVAETSPVELPLMPGMADGASIATNQIAQAIRDMKDRT